MKNTGKSHEITREETLLRWLQIDRNSKVTSFTTICRQFCLMRDFKGVLQSLVDAGHIRKLSRGYKASTRPGADDDPRHDLYKELLPLLDKDIDELYETDLHNFFLTIQDRIRNAKERLARVLKGN